MELRPVRLEPQFVPRIWGARSLAALFPDKRSLAEPIGEVWLTGNACRFADGPFTGKTLGETWPRMTAEWAGKSARPDQPFPLLVKFIFPEDKLSLQVHPDDAYARQREAAAGGVGKTEMWYVVSARPGAEARVGLKAGVTRDQFRRAIAGGAAEDCVERVPVEAGDAIFVPAGTVHTIGPGMILCEVQQNSDITYRVFDYHRLTAQGKPRELHIEKAMEVIRFREPIGGKREPVETNQGGTQVTYYVACKFFAVEKWHFQTPISPTTTGEDFELLIPLEGRGQFATDAGKFTYGPAQLWFLPAGLGRYPLRPDTPTTLLHTLVPHDLEQYQHKVIRDGASDRDAARVMFR